MTTRSNTPPSQSGSKERLRPWITISKHQMELKLHLMPRTLFITLLGKENNSINSLVLNEFSENFLIGKRIL